MRKLSNDAAWCWEVIQENPGVRMITLAMGLAKSHSVYGKQKAATMAIAELRRAGLVEDCPRCPVCNRALSRHRRNVPLYPTNMSKEERTRQGFLL